MPDKAYSIYNKSHSIKYQTDDAVYIEIPTKIISPVTPGLFVYAASLPVLCNVISCQHSYSQQRRIPVLRCINPLHFSMDETQHSGRGSYRL